jgi:hypothetical protein
MAYDLHMQASELQLDVEIDTELVNSASCFNYAAREQLKEAQEEVCCLVEANCIFVRSLPVRTQRPFIHESPIKRLIVP